jgi:hypothetical protein
MSRLKAGRNVGGGVDLPSGKSGGMYLLFIGSSLFLNPIAHKVLLSTNSCSSSRSPAALRC